MFSLGRSSGVIDERPRGAPHPQEAARSATSASELSDGEGAEDTHARKAAGRYVLRDDLS